VLAVRRPALRVAQHRALGRKVSDEFTVPLCPAHHRESTAVAMSRMVEEGWD